GARHEHDAQRAAEPLARTLGRAQRALRLRHRAACFFQEHAAGLRELADAVAALDQRGAELGLDLADGGRERWLRHAQALGGAAKAEFLGDGDELAELAELDHGDIRSISISQPHSIGSIANEDGHWARAEAF